MTRQPRTKKPYPWTAETFPKLSERQHDLLCIMQDAGGLLCVDDLLYTLNEDSVSADEVRGDVSVLLDHKLAIRRVSGREEFFKLTRNGETYLDEPPPEGVRL